MGKGKGKGRHHHRRGPGGGRPTDAGGSRRVTRPGGDAPPTAQLVDALLAGFEPISRDAPIQDILGTELGTGRVLDTITERPGPHLRPLLTAIGGDLARRRTPLADVVLAVLARLATEADQTGLAQAWRTRSRDPDVAPAALHFGDDTVVEAVEIGHACGDGVNLALAIDNPAGSFTVAVYIDFNLGGMAKDALVGPPMSEMRATFDPTEGFTVRSVPPDEAFWRFLDAVDLLDHTLDPPVSEDFYDFLNAVTQRFALLGAEAGLAPQDPPWAHHEVSNAERLAHVAAFMSSPEYEALTVELVDQEDGADEAVGIVRLWIDHAVGYTIGPVRRVSPVLVELFCADWFPRKVMADEAMLAVAPAAIEAWLRFAARTTGLDDRWRDEALSALDEFAPALRGAVDDPTAWGLAKGLLGGAGLGALGGTQMFDEDDELVSTTTASWAPPPDGLWEPLEVTVEGTSVHVETDPSQVRPWQYAKAKLIASQASVQAATLLGPSFAQAAMDLAVALGSLDDSPYDNSQIRSWPGAIVWLLAEDNDAFEPRTPGRRRDDLADQLPLTRATYQTKAKRIREALDVPKGQFAVPHDPTRS